jgi:hypothetical protein
MRIRGQLSWGATASEFSWGRVAVALVIVLFLAGVGGAGYLLGKPGVDPVALRTAAVVDGREAGLKAGTKAGYAEGFESARDRTYVRAYSDAYREAYVRQFERAELEPPQRIRVPEPR